MYLLRSSECLTAGNARQTRKRASSLEKISARRAFSRETLSSVSTIFHF